MLKLTASGLESCKTLGEFIGVQAPDAESMQKLVDNYERLHAQEVPKRAEDKREFGLQKIKPNRANGEVSYAIDLCDSIILDLNRLPDGAEEFAESVGEKARSMRDWMMKNNRATDKMISSLENMRAGVDKWLRE